MAKSLKRQEHALANPDYQLEVLNEVSTLGDDFPSFSSKLAETGLDPLTAIEVETLQVNVGKMCNQVCKHCHVDAGPDRKEIMTRETMQQCVDAVKNSNIKTVDLTGGAPEMNPDFRWFVEQLSPLVEKIIVRCNLTIILANKKYHDLPEFYKKHKIEVVSSLPYFTATRTDAQRGDGVFESSIKALKMLNEVGYGQEGTGLNLHLVYNPSGAFLPGDENQLQREFKQKLYDRFGIVFNDLYAITNLPISRFLEYLVNTGNYESYMETLVNAYNPIAAENVMCRSTLSVGWEGSLYDCDFNQMLELQVEDSSPKHIKDFNATALDNRQIIVNQHCYGCTAGAGSSCGGAVT